MKLFIVESPNKCGKLRKYLGEGWSVSPSVGHIRSIPRKGLNIDIKSGFVPLFEISSDKKKVVKELKSLAEKADEIILATDPDREGEAIAWHIYDLFNASCKKKCHRITFDEITQSAVKKALNSKRDIDMNLVNAQKARQVLDRLIGYKISPMLWFTIGKGTSAGRVQSIALKIISEREIEIQNFKPQDFWYIEALLKCKKGEFWAKVVTKDKDNRYLDEKLSQDDFEKLKKATFSIDNIDPKEKIVNAHPPFDTSSLQSTCGGLFGWSVKKTAVLSQSLYEKGLLTYIRTDSFNISQEALDEVRDYISNTYDKNYMPSKANVYHKKSKSAAQEAHECIRPTKIKDQGEDIDTADEQKLYKLIRDRFISCQMSPMLVDTLTYNIKTSSKHKLIAKGQTVKFDGWSKAYKYSSAKEELLPQAEKGEDLDLVDIKRTKHTTQPPARYSEASLVKKLESEGVGRPSTYPSIMESIQKRGYAEKVNKNKMLQPTELGLRVYNYLQPNFKDFFMDIGFTSNMENDLDEIANGKKEFLEIVSQIYQVMMEEIAKAKKDSPTHKELESTGEPCTVCKKGYIIERHGKFGNFFACDQYPECKSVFVKDEEGKFSLKEKKQSTTKETGISCPVCKKGKIVSKKGQYGEFFACNNYPSCKTIFEEKNGEMQIKKKYSKKGNEKSSKYDSDSDGDSDTHEDGLMDDLDV